MRGRNRDEVEKQVRSSSSQVADTGPAVLESFPQPSPAEDSEADPPVMPSPRPFPTFHNKPSLSHQLLGNGFESGRDSRAR